ncbi:MAG: S16 family serine protease [Candidatus Micrarchaeota archaeon]
MAKQKRSLKHSLNFLLVAAIIIVCAAAAALFLGYALFPSSRETRFQAAAVSDSGEGVIVDFALRSRPGNGALLINVENAEWRADAEKSFRASREHAENFLGVPLSNRDYELELRSREGGVEGESAGAAFAIAIIANYLNAEPRSDAIVSAALDSENSSNEALLPIGGAEEKILAAAQAGKRVFVVAQDQTLKYEGELARRIQVERARTLCEAVQALLRRTS